MNGVDLLVVIVSGIAGVRGFRRGLVREGLEAAAALGGVVAGYRAYGSFGISFAISTGLPPGLTRPLLFVVTAVAIASVGFLAARAAARAVAERSGWAVADNLGGLGFGVLKGVFYSSLIVIAAAQTPAAWVTEALDGSAFGRALYAVAPDVYRHVDVWLMRSE